MGQLNENTISSFGKLMEMHVEQIIAGLGKASQIHRCLESSRRFSERSMTGRTFLITDSSVYELVNSFQNPGS